MKAQGFPCAEGVRATGVIPGTSAVILLAMLIFGMVLFPVPASAQAKASEFSAAVKGPGEGTEISVTGEVDRKTITIGDNVLYTVTVVHPFGVTVEMPPFASNLGAFEIKDYRRPDRVVKEGSVIEKAEYVISTFTTGKYTIPPVTIAFLNPSGKASRLATEEMEVEVRSVVSSESELTEVRDLKGPVTIPPQGLPAWAAWIIVFSISVIMAGIIWWLRSRDSVIEETILVPMPPHDAAIMGLDRLEARDLPGLDRVREFYYELSEILRRYLCALTPGASMDQVTFELCESIASGPLTEHSAKLAEWMEFHDFAKFAKAEPQTSECASDLARVRAFVFETAVQEPEFVDEYSSGGNS